MCPHVFMYIYDLSQERMCFASANPVKSVFFFIFCTYRLSTATKAAQMDIGVPQYCVEEECWGIISLGGWDSRLGRPRLCLAAPTSL